MYPQIQTQTQDSYEDPINDFWKEYLFKSTGKNVYTSRKIITYAGGVCLFSAMGAQITGFGAGQRKPGYTGALIIDDANKPSEMRHQKYRNSIIQFYEETLLNRLNHSDVPIINIQQRLHVEDLSAVLKEKYNFTAIIKPLLDENGVCQIPSQYTSERIKELQANNYVFQSQFQQQPIIQGGQVIKRAYFRYYNTAQKYNYKRILIAADTAMKTKEHNDYSVFLAGGVTDNNQLHILDLLRGKWEAPDKIPVVEKSVRITPEQGLKFEIPRMKLVSKINGDFSKKGILLIEVAGTVLQPTKAGTKKMTATLLPATDPQE